MSERPDYLVLWGGSCRGNDVTERLFSAHWTLHEATITRDKLNRMFGAIGEASIIEVPETDGICWPEKLEPAASYKRSIEEAGTAGTATAAGEDASLTPNSPESSE